MRVAHVVFVFWRVFDVFQSFLETEYFLQKLEYVLGVEDAGHILAVRMILFLCLLQRNTTGKADHKLLECPVLIIAVLQLALDFIDAVADLLNFGFAFLYLIEGSAFSLL